MRIISGDLKNRRIYFEGIKNTRPLKDRVRESIFNILIHSHKISFIFSKNCSVLDLYSGTGSFGLECLSRNVREVYFVEKDINALSCLKKNIENYKFQEKSRTFKVDVSKYLEANIKKKFDLLFLDPPFAYKFFLKIIPIIKKNKILKKNHLIVLHREVNSKENLEKYFNIILKKTYGRSQIFFGRLF